EYLIAVITWGVGFAFYIAGVIGINWIAAASLPDSPIHTPPFLRWYLAYSSLIIGLYLLHFLCMHLGTLYRRHHERFPWVYQRHMRDPNRPAPAAGFPVRRGAPMRQPG